MRTTIDYHTGLRPDGTRCTVFIEVVTDESLYPNETVAADAHAAQVELLSLDRQDRVSAKELLEKEAFDPENEASVIRRCIAEAVGCCPYCSSQGQITRSEDGPDAQEVSLDAGNTEPLRGALCRGCRDVVGADIANGR
jgi:hypothetical protein